MSKPKSKTKKPMFEMGLSCLKKHDSNITIRIQIPIDTKIDISSLILSWQNDISINDKCYPIADITNVTNIIIFNMNDIFYADILFSLTKMINYEQTKT